MDRSVTIYGYTGLVAVTPEELAAIQASHPAIASLMLLEMEEARTHRINPFTKRYLLSTKPPTLDPDGLWRFSF